MTFLGAGALAHDRPVQPGARAPERRASPERDVGAPPASSGTAGAAAGRPRSPPRRGSPPSLWAAEWKVRSDGTAVATARSTRKPRRAHVDTAGPTRAVDPSEHSHGRSLRGGDRRTLGPEHPAGGRKHRRHRGARASGSRGARVTEEGPRRDLPPRLLTLVDVAALTGRSRRSLARDVRAGKLLVVRLGQQVRRLAGRVRQVCPVEHAASVSPRAALVPTAGWRVLAAAGIA